MYSTCLFCHRPLGANDQIEAFPVGKRLAFDSARGRLWVVCPHCARWNLAPLDERWEALEQCERAFHDTRIRVSTENIGLARLRDGTELVRIGSPLRPEFAAWRYSAQVARRRQRNLLLAGAGIAVLGGATAGLVAAGASVTGFQFLQFIPQAIERRRDKRVVYDQIVDGRRRTIRFGEVRLASWVAPTGPQEAAIELRLGAEVRGRKLKGGEPLLLPLSDPLAQRLLAMGMQRHNRYVGSKTHIADALGWLDAFGNPLQPGGLEVRRGLALPEGAPRDFAARRHDAIEPYYPHPRAMHELPGYVRLALEMAAHEEQERRFLALHLSVLEEAWQEAEQIAAIADDLLLPDWLRDRLGG